MAERGSFLEGVRLAMESAVLPADPEAVVDVTPPELPDVDLLGLFRERLAAVDGETHLITSADAVPSLTALLDEHGVRTVMTWDDVHLPVAGVGPALKGAAFSVVDHVTPHDRHAEHNATYANVDAGVTGATAGLAESGSIVLGSGPGRPRMASLVPKLHVALLAASAIHRSLTHLVLHHPEAFTGDTNTIVVTGPSRTADIEQRLNVGVHGPRYLHVVVIKDL